MDKSSGNLQPYVDGYGWRTPLRLSTNWKIDVSVDEVLRGTVSEL